MAVPGKLVVQKDGAGVILGCFVMSEDEETLFCELPIISHERRSVVEHRGLDTIQLHTIHVDEEVVTR